MQCQCRKRGPRCIPRTPGLRDWRALCQAQGRLVRMKCPASCPEHWPPAFKPDSPESRRSGEWRRKSEVDEISVLTALYSFTPVAVETLGAFGEQAYAFFCDLGHLIAAVTTEPRSFQFLMQRQSVTVQRGNAACVLGTVPASRGLDELFYI